MDRVSSDGNGNYSGHKSAQSSRPAPQVRKVNVVKFPNIQKTIGFPTVPTFGLYKRGKPVIFLTTQDRSAGNFVKVIEDYYLRDKLPPKGEYLVGTNLGTYPTDPDRAPPHPGRERVEPRPLVTTPSPRAERRQPLTSVTLEEIPDNDDNNTLQDVRLSDSPISPSLLATPPKPLRAAAPLLPARSKMPSASEKVEDRVSEWIKRRSERPRPREQVVPTIATVPAAETQAVAPPRVSQVVKVVPASEAAVQKVTTPKIKEDARKSIKATQSATAEPHVEIFQKLLATMLKNKHCLD